MKLKKKTVKVSTKNIEVKEEKKPNTLPSDEYKPMFEPLELLVREYPSFKNASKMVKEYLQIKVVRFGEDGLPFVFISTRQESNDKEIYQGFLKGKTVKFPLEQIYSVSELLDGISETCEELGIE